MSKSQVTGIDIGHHSIKAVVLKQSKGTFKLIGYQELPIESDIFADNHVLSYQKIVKKLKELRKQLPLFSRNVALAIPDNAVISKVLQVDRELDEQETEFAILQAFAHQSPFPVEELNLDYVEIVDGERKGRRNFQVYATKREVVDTRTQAATKAGFTPALMDVQAHGLIQVWQLASELYKKDDWLLVDVGFSQTMMCMDFFDKTPFCKDIALGTQFIQSEQAEPTFNHLGIERFIAELVEKMQRNIQLITSVHRAQIAGIWLVGGGALVPMLAEEVERRLNLECQRLNPLTLFSNSNSKKGRALGEEYAYATAAGLAIRGLMWQEVNHAS